MDFVLRAELHGMETQQTTPTNAPPSHLRPLETQKLTLKKDAKCALCGEEIMNQERTELLKPILNSREVGVVHQGCFAPYLGEVNLRILFSIRCFSIGDTIASTPVLRELKRLYPKTPITVMTFFPDLFRFNPYVSLILDLNQPITKDMLDAHHFKVDAFDTQKFDHFASHSVEFSAMCGLSKSLLPTEWAYDLFYEDQDLDRARAILVEHGVDPEKDKVILIHPHGTEWSTRDWGPNRFPELAKKLSAKYPDHRIISIGGKRSESGHVMKNHVPIPEAIDLYGRLTLLQSAALMDLPCMKVMITPDTGTLHLAATRPELPIVGIFTLVKAYMRTPVRQGRFGYKFIGVEAESGCNCTYDAKSLSHEISFIECPKLAFYRRTAQANLPKPVKVAACEDFEPNVDWDVKTIGKQLLEMGKVYNPKSLPCFPSTDRVMSAVERFLG